MAEPEVRNGAGFGDSRYYLAVDIGASSGRHMLGHLEGGRMVLEEVYRFENGMTERDGKKLWDTERLFGEILEGMGRCRALGRIPVSMSIDTWAVDYVLLDGEGRVLGDTYAYRDRRTEGMDREVSRFLSEEALYARTGIQKQSFNTIYQLMAVKKAAPELFEEAETFLMLPDYFQYRLTGNRVSEYTNATSTQLVNPASRQWDRELIGLLGFPQGMFLPLSLPGTRVGRLTEEVRERVGFDLEVCCCASHDTASAVMAMPGQEGLYISSGTWSLMGTEREAAACDERSRAANFTSEGGYDFRFRYLKNIMGLWMIQSVRHECGDAYSFARLCEMAEECREFPSRVDVNDGCFLAPENMTAEIQNYCRRTGQRVPETVGETAAVIYRSLAASYGGTAKEIEENCGRPYDRIHVIGGGANADYLNRLTAEATGKEILAGPTEATAIGNVMAQMIRDGELRGLAAARDCVARSFPIRRYAPGTGRESRICADCRKQR